MTNINARIKEMAAEIVAETDNLEEALDLCHQYADGMDTAIYYGKAIQFCANENTDEGEDFLEDSGGIVQAGDSFGAIACRIAYAEICCRLQEAVTKLYDEKGE